MHPPAGAAAAAPDSGGAAGSAALISFKCHVQLFLQPTGWCDDRRSIPRHAACDLKTSQPYSWLAHPPSPAFPPATCLQL